MLDCHGSFPQLAAFEFHHLPFGVLLTPCMANVDAILLLAFLVFSSQGKVNAVLVSRNVMQRPNLCTGTIFVYVISDDLVISSC